MKELLELISKEYAEALREGLSPDEAHSIAISNAYEHIAKPINREKSMRDAAEWIAAYFFWDEPNEEKQREMERIRDSFAVVIS
jgi:hypothetical protein